MTHVTMAEIYESLKLIDREGTLVYGVPRGGLCAAAFLTQAKVVDDPAKADVILDDLVDSGATRERYQRLYPNALFHTCLSKIKNPELGWVVFPWETETGPEDAVVRMLEYIGEDPHRDGLLDTPKRVVKAFREMTSGMHQQPSEILSTTFDVQCDDMVLVRDIPFTSLCEHHMLPFTGSADVAYIPGLVVGLSKIPRLVDCFAHRLQIQERLTHQIAAAIETHLKAQGVAVVVKGKHACMSCRGVRKSAPEMVTSAMLGRFFDNAITRSEFLQLTR